MYRKPVEHAETILEIKFLNNIIKWCHEQEQKEKEFDEIRKTLDPSQREYCQLEKEN